MTEIITASIIFVGVLFVLLGAVGLLRLPDFYIRVSAITKAATAGVSCIMIAVAFYANDINMASKAFVVVLFLLVTSPIAAHIIGRAAYNDGVPLWDKTQINEFEAYQKSQAQKNRDANTASDMTKERENLEDNPSEEQPLS